MGNNIYTKIILLTTLSFFLSCDKEDSVYYLNSDTKEFFSEDDFIKFQKMIREKYKDTIEKIKVNYTFESEIVAEDSLIRPFKLDIRSGKNYIRKSLKQEYIFTFLSKKIPFNNLKTLSGREISLEDLLNKPTVINFWFTNCKPCVQEIEILNKLKKEYSRRVNFLAITFDSKEEVRSFLKKKPFNFEHIVNADDYISMLGIVSFPKTVFLDKKGNISYIENGIPLKDGVSSDVGFKMQIEDLLNGY